MFLSVTTQKDGAIDPRYGTLNKHSVKMSESMMLEYWMNWRFSQLFYGLTAGNRAEFVDVD